MYKLFILIIFILLQGCSFDSKSGIWNNENIIPKKENDIFAEFEALSNTNKIFDEEIVIQKNYEFNLTKPTNNFVWKDVYYNMSNTTKNFDYLNKNQLLFKSKKISKYSINELILFDKNNIITSDKRGNINIFSIEQNKIVSKFNFYKKRYKKIDKILNMIVEDDIIYISDNIGYLYAFNYSNQKILWAKNYKIPFRSNIKIFKNKIIAANQNNNLYFFDKNNGEILKLIPTEETVVKNNFINSISLNEKYTFFLNNYGSLYAIDNKDITIEWFINLNQSLDLNPSNLFQGNQVINSQNKVIVTSNNFTYILDSNSGSIIDKKNLVPIIKPLIIDNYLFLINKNNLLVCINLKKSNIIYSFNINRKIADFLNIEKKKALFKNIIMANNKLFVFLKNSYLLKFKVNGEIENVIKLPSKLNSYPIFIDGSMLYLDRSQKISIVN